MSDPGDEMWDAEDYPEVTPGAAETDPRRLVEACEAFMTGAKRHYDSGRDQGNMWFFVLFHHLHDCAEALRKTAGT